MNKLNKPIILILSLTFIFLTNCQGVRDNLSLKKKQEKELLKLKAEAIKVEKVICANNKLIKDNIETNVKNLLDVKKLHLNGLVDLLENITNTYNSLPESILKTPEFLNITLAWKALLKEAKKCKPSEDKLVEVERELLSVIVQSGKVLDDLVDHKCNKIINIIEDFLTLNSLQQKYIENILVFDKAPNNALLFININNGLAKMGELTGMAIGRLIEVGEDVRVFEREFVELMDTSVLLVEQLRVPIKCIGNKVDMLLECEISKLPRPSNLRKGLMLSKKAFDALREFNTNIETLEGVFVTNIKDIASVSKDVLSDIYEFARKFMEKESYKNEVVQKYFAINTSSVSTLLEADIEKDTKVIVGNTFVLVGLGVRTFANDALLNDLPQLPLITCANLTEVEDNLKSLLLRAAADIILRTVSDVALKIESTREFLVMVGDSFVKRVEELAKIDNKTRVEVLKLVPKLINDVKLAITNFNNIVRLGLNLTLESASTKLNC